MNEQYDFLEEVAKFPKDIKYAGRIIKEGTPLYKHKEMPNRYVVFYEDGYFVTEMPIDCVEYLLNGKMNPV